MVIDELAFERALDAGIGEDALKVAAFLAEALDELAEGAIDESAGDSWLAAFGQLAGEANDELGEQGGVATAVVDAHGIGKVGDLYGAEHITDLVEAADAVAVDALAMDEAGVQLGHAGDGSLHGLTQVEGVDGAQEASVEDVRLAAISGFLRHWVRFSG